MSITFIFFTGMPVLSISEIMSYGWVKAFIISIVFFFAYVYHRVKLKAEKNKRAEMESKMLEKSELLSYSTRSEQKAKEKPDLANRSKST